MSDDVISDSHLKALLTDNPYLPQKKWLRELQNIHLTDFMQRGFPTRREEHWKYTDMSQLANENFGWAHKLEMTEPVRGQGIVMVFVNGFFYPALSDLSALPPHVILCPISQALEQHEELLKPFLQNGFDSNQYPFACLNTALMTDGFLLSVPDNVEVNTPIHCLFLNTQQQDFMIHPRNIIDMGANSYITIIEEYAAIGVEKYLTNAVTTFHAAQNAHISYHKIQAESKHAIHIANMFLMQDYNSVIKNVHLAIGSHLAREDVTVSLQAEGTESYLYGLYHLSENGQHVDNHLLVSHAYSRSKSVMLYKGILDKKSRAVFNGKAYVHKDVQHINAAQANHNILLSDTAEINSKPELEIYSDDVKCTHGATVGQLDKDALFYLRSRGIESEEALKLLTQAFATEVLNKIENPSLRNYISQRAGYHE